MAAAAAASRSRAAATRTPDRGPSSIDGAGTVVGRAALDGGGAGLPGRTSVGIASAATRPSAGATETGRLERSCPPTAAVGTECPGVTRATGAAFARRVCTLRTASSAGLAVARFGVDVSTAGGRAVTPGSVVRVATRAASSRVVTRKDSVRPAFTAPAPVTVNPGEVASTAVGASAVAAAAAAGAAGAARDACGDATLGAAGTSDAGWAAAAGAAGSGDGASLVCGAAGGAAGAGVAAAAGAATGAGDCTGGG